MTTTTPIADDIAELERIDARLGTLKARDRLTLDESAEFNQLVNRSQKLRSRVARRGGTIPNKVPYCACGRKAELVSASEVYTARPDLKDKKLWLCRQCNAYVGCHVGSTEPLGTLADAKTRRARMAAHLAFDPLWKNRYRGWSRRAWYKWLARKLGISVDSCHIGNFGATRCEQVVAICAEER